ncbi:mitogen-activated protein kinase kinase kinase ANP1 [Argentina anserina]|uniref:mitogen-activated protein kinase kinase kinase ANP1 n=1 Tax=Argentina anserina TaxID=57926 RepID=UPI00217644AA|nr:mitogen-activated protein kinase kinase kinase ANP1 [Potentilla anserina]
MSSENHQEFKRPVQWSTRDLYIISSDLCTAPVLESKDEIVVRKVQVAKYISKEEANAQFKKLEDRVKYLQNLCHHPNLLKYLGTAKKGRTLFILSECVGHSNISSLVKKQKQFPELELVS